MSATDLLTAVRAAASTRPACPAPAARVIPLRRRLPAKLRLDEQTRRIGLAGVAEARGHPGRSGRATRPARNPVAARPPAEEGGVSAVRLRPALGESWRAASHRSSAGSNPKIASEDVVTPWSK